MRNLAMQLGLRIAFANPRRFKRRARLAAALIVLGAILFGSGRAHAGDVGDYVRASGEKLGHGVLSIPYGVVDVGQTPVLFAIDMDSDGRGLVGFVLGIPCGVLNGGIRATRGAWDVVTFLFVNDPQAARDFKFDPYVTGARPFAPPQPERPITRVASQRREAPRRSGD